MQVTKYKQNLHVFVAVKSNIIQFGCAEFHFHPIRSISFNVHTDLVSCLWDFMFQLQWDMKNRA